MEEIKDTGKEARELEERLTARWGQDLVDFVRGRVLYHRIEAIRGGDENGWRPGYVWFPEPSIDKQEWRFGSAPDDMDRPQHLRGMSLSVDTRKIVDRLMIAGHDAATIAAMAPQDQYTAIKRALNDSVR